MKKLYISICVIAVSCSANAQTSSNVMNSMSSAKEFNELVVSDSQIFNPIINNSSSSMNIIWESDFTDPTLWTLDNSGQNGGAYGWSIDGTVDGWWSTNGISSTSGGNYAELSNGDAQQASQMLNVTYTMTTALPIDIGAAIGSPNAVLSFEEYGARFNDLQEVQISLDGTTFTTIADNLNYSVLSQSGGAAYANPTAREITLAPYIQANTSSVWIRFSWTTNYPNSSTNPNVWIAYGWYIDDVKVYESPANSITMTEEVIGGWWVNYLNTGGLGQDYTFNPIVQATANPYAFEAVITNEGSVEQQVQMYAEVFDGSGNSVFNSSSTANTLLSIENDTFLCNSFFTPSNLDIYSVEMWSIADSLGQGLVMTYSDTATKMTFVTDYIYGKDNNLADGSWRIGRSAGGLEVSSTYDIYADADIFSVEANITDWSVPGALVYAVLYEEDMTGGDPILLDQTDDYTIQPSDLGAWITLSFSSEYTLTAGTTFRIALGSYLNPLDTVGINTSGVGNYSSQGLYDKDGIYSDPVGTPNWYTISDIPMLRMNFDPGNPNAISDVNQTVFTTYPNPTNGIFTIKLGEVANYDVTVNNVLGQTVFSNTTKGMNTIIDLSSFDKGIYTVELKDENAIYTEKIIVE
ncbi:MAG: T9SS type A sorting domain-containing protein [Cryomorphaceae bacterium]|nr:T9SS type A sorting domain-containing protein [Cryomorphaceae bacterium]